jgi:superfamily II DNA helicase RecQ
VKNYFSLTGVRVFRFFTIPLRDVSSAETELNAFLGSHRVLGVERHFVDRGANSFWTLCVDYLPGVASAAAPSFDKKGRIDYREVLPPEDFLVFVKLRDLRKQIAQAEAVPVYTIFTNDQLADMVRRRLHTLADLQTIVGVGEARVSKYGPAFLTALQAVGGTRETSGQPA